MPRPPDGQEIIFRATSEAGTYGLFAIGSDGTGLRAIGEPAKTTPADLSFQDPVLSPDGTTIAYWNWEPKEAGATSSDNYLHVRDVTTGDDVPIQFAEDRFGLLAHYSPDGTMVVYETNAGAGQRLRFGSVDGSVPGRLIGPEYSYLVRHGFDFSPDGTKVVLFLASKSVLIDLVTDEWTDLDIASDFVSWQRLAKS
ncbi:MAG: hypothetical protein ABWZ82_00470 [Candidatus Limnocylindrales bacterium]